ncbi:MAG: metal-dependent transcriptional regulator [Pyrinomonadaceae bacterium]
MVVTSGSNKQVTQSTEDYLKAVFSLSEARAEREASTGDLAEALGVSPPAISKMLKHLEKQSLVAHTPYHGVCLTKKGRRIALKTIRRHRLLELFLAQLLGYALESVHDEAERLEHHISDEFERRIDALLGSPDCCPHGSPIPTRDGQIVSSHGQPLSDIEPPASLRIERLRASDAELLRHLSASGLLPGKVIRLIKREPFGGDLNLEIDKRRLRLSCQAARSVIVSLQSTQRRAARNT